MTHQSTKLIAAHSDAEGNRLLRLTPRESKDLHALVCIAYSTVDPDKVPLPEYIRMPDSRTLYDLLVKTRVLSIISELEEAT